MAISISGVSLVPMDGERVLDGHTVVIEDDRITWIGPDADAAVPPGAQHIDGRGKYLMPGLADMHCHPATEDDLLLCVAHGVTSIRNLEGMPRHVLWRDRVAAGQLLGPTIHTSGPIVDGRPVRGNGSLSVVDRDEAVAAVELTKRGRYEFVKVYDQLSVEAYGWIMAAARERDLQVVGHIPFRVGLHRILEAGQRSIEHLYGYPQALQPASRPAGAPRDLGQLRTWLFDQAEHAELGRIPELAAKTRESGTWNCPTLLVRTRWLADQAELLACPELGYVSPARAAHARYFVHHYPTEPGRRLVCELNAAVVRGLSDAGAGLLVGTDAGIPGVVYGASVHEELRAFVDAGLSPYQALRAATYDPAVFFGQAGEWGTIAVGARADLLLVDANPLLDVANAGRIAGVMARGRWLPQSEIADLLAGLAERARTPVAHRERVAGTSSAAPGADRLRYALSWDGKVVGAEEITAEPQPAGGHRIEATSSLDSLGSAVGSESGVYRASVSVDAAGADQAAWFEYDGDDGLDRVEMTRVNGSIHIRHSDATTDGTETTVADPDATMLFGRPLTALFLRLAERLAGLAVGAQTDVRVFGPCLSPDPAIGEATLRAKRLSAPDDADAGPRYAIEFLRPSWTVAALLICDPENRPLELEMGSDLGHWHNNADGETDPASVVRVSRE